MSEGGIYPWKRQPKDGYVYQDQNSLLKPLPPPPEGLMWIKTRVVMDEHGEMEVGEVVADQEAVVAPPTMPEEEEGKENEEARPQPRYVTRWELVEKLMYRGGKGNKEEDANGQGGDEEEVEEEEEEEEEEEVETEQAFLTHTVLPTDTMAGLRLRYKISAADLRKHNNFAGEQIHMLQTLRIPLKPEAVTHVAKYRQRPTKDVIRQQFINATGTTDEQEIYYYLSDANWKLAEAVAAYEEDKAWEEEHNAHVQCVRLAASAFAAASAPPLPAAAAMGSSSGEIPPPAYSSFFRKPRTAATGLSGRSNSQKKVWSFSSFSMKKKRTAVYDMDNVVASSSTLVEDEYVMLSSGDESPMHEGQALLSATASAAANAVGGADGMLVARVTDVDDHLQTPLLGRG